jgi:hypothetical protein
MPCAAEVRVLAAAAPADALPLPRVYETPHSERRRITELLRGGHRSGDGCEPRWARPPGC